GVVQLVPASSGRPIKDELGPALGRLGEVHATELLDPFAEPHGEVRGILRELRERLLGIGALEPDEHERASVGVLLNRPRLSGDAAALLRLVIPRASRSHSLLGEGASCLDLAREHRERTVEDCHRPASLLSLLPCHDTRYAMVGSGMPLSCTGPRSSKPNCL